MQIPTNLPSNYVGVAQVIDVYDGDTVHVLLSLGFQIYWHTKLRVEGINCPELPTPEGLSAKAFTAALLIPGNLIGINSKRLDKYGRIQAVITLNDGRDLGTLLLSSGHAVIEKP